MYKFIHEQIALCDEEIKSALQLMVAQKQDGGIQKIPETEGSTQNVSRKKKNKSHPAFSTASI